MKALCWHGKGDVRVDTVPDPKIEDAGDVIIKITATAICGSDLHIYNGLIPQAKPFIVGHEFMGIVEEVGPEVKKLRRGDRAWSAVADAAGIARIVDVELGLGENALSLEARNAAGDRSPAVTWRLIRVGAAPPVAIPGLAPLGMLVLVIGLLATGAARHRREARDE